MAKGIVKLHQQKTSAVSGLEKIKKSLSEKHACYVLITCSQPSDEGKMDVEMNYEGDETLAAFLLENASQVFDSKLNDSRESK